MKGNPRRLATAGAITLPPAPYVAATVTVAIRPALGQRGGSCGAIPETFQLAIAASVPFYGCTKSAAPRSRRIDCITWNAVLAVNTSAAAKTPVYFSITGTAAVSATASR